MEEIFSNFSRDVQRDYNLQNKHLYKKKTGNAKGYYQLAFDESLNTDLKALHEMYKQDLPFRIYGLHTNLYLTDNGYNGLFVDIDTKNSSIQFNKETEEFIVTANLTVSELVNYTKTMGYDFSALTGIPGLIGSGVVGNSSYAGSFIVNKNTKGFSDFTKKIIVYDFEIGDFVEMIPDDNFFGIRDSLLKQANKTKTRYFVKEVILKADYIGKEKVTGLYNAQIEERREALKINFTEGNEGSFFSNPHIRKSIGKIMKNLLSENPSINIDINGATFSSHGSRNFRTGTNTTDKDAANCLQHVVNKVKEIYSLDLHKEVIILDSDGEIDLETFIARNI